MKAIIENVKLVLSLGFIGIILLYIGTILFMPDLTVKIFRFQPFIVVTESMEPVINVNDMVVVTPFDIEEAEVGDIITFKADIDYNGSLEVITHYIYSIDRTVDNPIIRTHRYFEDEESVVPDTWLIPESDVIGAYSFSISNVGYFTGFITSIYGIVIIGFNVLIIGGIIYINKKSKLDAEQDIELPSDKEEE